MNPNRHLNNKDIDNVLDIINSWPRNEKLTWLPLIYKIEKLLFIKKSANALRNHKLIYQAYKAKKEGFNIVTSEIPIDLKVAHDRIEKLESTLETYKATISRYDLVFLTMQKNAYKKGLTEDDLFDAMQEIDRSN